MVGAGGRAAVVVVVVVDGAGVVVVVVDGAGVVVVVVVGGWSRAWTMVGLGMTMIFFSDEPTIQAFESTLQVRVLLPFE